MGGGVKGKKTGSIRTQKMGLSAETGQCQNSPQNGVSWLNQSITTKGNRKSINHSLAPFGAQSPSVTLNSFWNIQFQCDVHGDLFFISVTYESRGFMNPPPAHFRFPRKQPRSALRRFRLRKNSFFVSLATNSKFKHYGKASKQWGLPGIGPWSTTIILCHQRQL